MTFQNKVLVVFFLLLLLKNKVLSGSDPNLKWKTMHTPNFSINYYQGGKEIAKKVANIAEEVHEMLTKYLGLTPSQRTQVVIVNDIDSANAMATVYPYNQITIYAYPPENDDELGSFEDWLLQLFLHEYTHILHLDYVGGIPGFLNKIFGKTILPNAVLPNWWVEGLATLVETEKQNGGRIGNSLFEMYLRSAYYEGKFLELNQITNTPLVLPRGTAAYVYGGTFFKYLLKNYGIEKFRKFMTEYGKKLIPFGINIISRKIFGKDFISLYEEWKKEYFKKFDEIKRKIVSSGIITGEALTNDGEYKGYPVFGENERTLYFVNSNGKELPYIAKFDIEEKKNEELQKCYGGCEHLWFDRKNKELIFSKYDYFRTYYFYKDIFSLNLKNLKEKKCTEGVRARWPARLKNSNFIFVNSHYEKTFLNLYDEKRKKFSILLEGNADFIITNPRVSPNEKKVAFAGFKENKWDIYIMDIEKGEYKKITDNFNIERDIVWSPDGNGLFFSCDFDGIYNIYFYNLQNNELHKITNVLGGAFHPSISPDGEKMVFLSYSAKGYDLYMLKINNISIKKQVREKKINEKNKKNIPEISYLEKDYNALETLYPRNWKPTYYVDSSGFSFIGADIEAYDAVGLHNYFISTIYYFDETRPSIIARYTNNRYFPTLRFTGSYFPSDRYAFMMDKWFKIKGETYAGSFAIDLPFPHTKRSVFFTSSYYFEWSRKIESFKEMHDPAALKPHIPQFGTKTFLGFALSYDGTESYTYSISPEYGMRARLGASLSSPYLGSKNENLNLTYNFQAFLENPLLENHIFSFKTTGGISFGDIKTRHIFALGGYPKRDILFDLLNNDPLFGDFLRGYPSGAFIGDRFIYSSLEYRFPLFRVFFGPETLPLYLRNIHGAFFLDAGNAFYKSWTPFSLYWGSGMEIKIDMNFFYNFFYSLKIGYARGFQAPGGDMFYFLLSVF